MISSLSTGVTGDAGVSGVGLLFMTRLGWMFRSQPTADVGIDAQVEPVANTVPTGRLLGLQIKSGPSWVKEPDADGTGWWFREPDQRHRHYWLRYRLPVILVLYDIEAHSAYWQVINKDTAMVTGKGFKVFVPRGQRIDPDSAQALADLARALPDDPFVQQVENLPASCADSLTALREYAPELAQEVAEVLVRGRDDPAAAVQLLRERTAATWPWRLWCALAEYAIEYSLNRLAADCLIQAAAGCDVESTRARMSACAGIFLMTDDPDQARCLLDEASASSGGVLLAAVGLASLDHGQRDGPIAVPAVLAEHPEQAEAEATVQWFLGDNAARRGDTDAAIGFHGKALTLAPRSSAQMLALAEALLRRREPEPGSTSLADYHRAAWLAEQARAARRRCRADSVPAATILLHAINLGGDERSAIRVAEPAPEGDATGKEAESPELAFYAARLCYETGNVAAGDRFAASIERSGRAEWITHCAAVKASNGGATSAEQISRWQSYLATQAPDNQRLVALNHLAGLGVWPLPDLERLRERGFLAEGFYDTVHAEALDAAGRASEGLALLRSRSRTSIVTAEFYARKLANQGHLDESVRVCDESAMRFGDARLELLALDVLTEAGRTDTVVARVTELLGRDDLPANLRHRVRNRLIDVHGSRRDWLRAEKLARAGLTEVKHLLRDSPSPATGSPASFKPAVTDLYTWRRDYSWAVITCQLHRNQSDDAYRTLEQLDPEVDTPGQIAAWGDLHRIHGWTPATAERALSLATRDGVPLTVAVPILSSLVQTLQAPTDTNTSSIDTSRVAISVGDEFRQRLTDTWADLTGRHPAVIRTLRSDGPQFAEQVRDLLLPNSIDYGQAREAVRAGRLPLGALSAAARTPYLLGLVRNAAGMISAVSASPESHEREVDAAREAVGGTIIIEGCALYLASAVTGFWPTARDAFMKVLLPERAARDVIHTHQMVRESVSTVGLLNVDSDAGDPHFTPSDHAARMVELESTDKVLRASQECRPVVVERSGEFGAALNSDTIGPWLSPVAAAIADGVALYSDDAYIRRLAGYFGVQTFGTLALVEVFLETGQLEAQASEAIVEALFWGSVVDLPNVWPLVARAAQTAGASAHTILTNVARPSFWHDIGEDNIVPALATLAQHLERNTHAIELFTGAAVLGLTKTFGPPERVLAILGTIIILAATDLTDSSVEPVLRPIRRLAASHGWDPVPLMHEDLIRAMTDPEDSFAMSAVEAAATADRLLGMA